MTTVEVLIPWHDSGCEWRQRSWDWVRATWQIRHPEWPVIAGCNDGEFTIPASLNALVARSTADILVFSGADVVWSSSAVRHGVIDAERAPFTMLNDAMVRLDIDQTRAVHASPPGSEVPQSHGGSQRMLCQLGWGMLIMQREAFEKVCWDERLTAAWEDSVFGEVANLMLGPPKRVARNNCVLLYHPKAYRSHHPEFPDGEVLWHKYLKLCRAGNVEGVRELMKGGAPAWWLTQSVR